MKKNLMAIILMLSLIVSIYAKAEGLLPSLTDTIGKPMPSLGEALGRYPDEERPNDDGSNTEVFRGVTETDFNTFSIYLSWQGAILADYQVSGNSFSSSIQVDEKMISFIYNMQTLEATVTYPKGTYDEWLDYAKAQYESAVQLLNSEKTDDALAILLSIPGYDHFAQTASLLADNSELAAIVSARKAKLEPYKTIGEYVNFGTYPQTVDGMNNMPIEWLILDYDAANNSALLISRYGLDAKPFNEKYASITWEKCTLRTWLNSTFYRKAFNASEQYAILLTNVDNSESQGYSGWSTSGSNNTQDRIFLLSYSEANKYFNATNLNSKKIEFCVSPTAYAIDQGAFTSGSNLTSDGTAAGWWWLRSPGGGRRDAAYVDYDGSFDYNSVSNKSGTVRPAFWLNLDAYISN